jgi:hypothetical protein
MRRARVEENAAQYSFFAEKESPAATIVYLLRVPSQKLDSND